MFFSTREACLLLQERRTGFKDIRTRNLHLYQNNTDFWAVGGAAGNQCENQFGNHKLNNLYKYTK
jgi:hypothetical protein